MKKLIAILGIVSTILLAGCASHQVKQVDPIPVDVQITMNVDDDTEVMLNEKYPVKGGVPEISQLSWVDGKFGYTKLFSGLSVSDVTRSWNDWVIFEALGIRNVMVMINSPGGDAFSGLALASMVKYFEEERGFTISMFASGIVASAAVPIFASGKKGSRVALSSTIFMVHEAALWKWPGRETSSDIRSQGELMGLLGDQYRKILADNTKINADEWLTLEARTSWFSCEKGIELGLVDECK